jgi:hypothetical protein
MTVTRLQRWQKNGVMPSADQSRVPGRRGSTSVYPRGAFTQARTLASTLDRHRNFDKAAILLFFNGYPVETKALRQALTAGLDHLDQKIDRYKGNAADPDTIATKVATAMVDEPLRTKAERAYRKKQIADAGGRDKLILAHASLLRIYLGGATLGGFLSGMGRFGFDQGRIGLDDESTRRFKDNVEQQIHELNRSGGLGTLFRSALPTIDLEGFQRLREFMRGATRWMAGLGVSFDASSPFLAEVHHALLRPELPEQNGESPKTS